MKVFAIIYHSVLGGALLLSPGARALESNTKNRQESFARVSQAKEGRVLLAQNQSNEKTAFIAMSSGQVGKPFRLDVQLKPNAAGQWRALFFKKPPSACAFSPGIRIDDTHYISLADVGNITITVSKGAPAEMNVPLVLMNDDLVKEIHDLKIAVAGANVSVYEADEKGTAPAVSAAAPSPVAQKSVTEEWSIAPMTVAGPPRLDSSLENSYLQRARNLLKLGQIVSARQLLEHLTTKGSAQGALLLGETYDETYLKAMNVMGGVSADRDEALRWYRKAQEFGSTEATARIRRLE